MSAVNHDRYDDAYLRRILRDTKTIAMVGASANWNRPSYFAMKYLLDRGYKVIPVNPAAAGQEIMGQKVYGSLDELPQKADMVDIFRNSEAAGPITDEAIKHGAKVVWMQLGVRNDAAAQRAEAAGLKVVMNRCPKIEHSPALRHHRMARHRQRRHQQQEAGALAMASSAEYAVFTEFSPDTKPAMPGWNRRVFTDTDVRKGSAIQCDFTTGIVTLAPAPITFPASPWSPTSPRTTHPETIVTRSPASAGYCRLRRFDPDAVVDPANLRGLPNSDPRVICIGSPSTANLVPSLFETFYETDRPAQIVLEHQSGSKPEQIYLRVFVENSKWHVFARISIRGL